MHFLKIVCLTALTTALADALWFSFSLSRLYTPLMGPLINPHPVWLAAVLFYLLFAVGLSYFVIDRAISRSPIKWRLTVFEAIFFGLAAYGTYDLTAMAVIAGWRWPLALIDMAWGGMIALIATVVVTYSLKPKSQ